MVFAFSDLSFDMDVDWSDAVFYVFADMPVDEFAEGAFSEPAQ